MICKYLKHEDTKLIEILVPVGRYNLVSIHADMRCERGMGVHVSMAFICFKFNLCMWVCLCMACM